MQLEALIHLWRVSEKRGAPLVEEQDYKYCNSAGEDIIVVFQATQTFMSS